MKNPEPGRFRHGRFRGGFGAIFFGFVDGCAVCVASVVVCVVSVVVVCGGGCCVVRRFSDGEDKRES